MKIYVASSWGNNHQQDVVRRLRELEFEVYDFKDENSFHWSECDPAWQTWKTDEYVKALARPLAVAGFKTDFEAMQWADACVLVLPCGRSAHLEAGWFVGQDKPLLILWDESEAELMYKMAAGIYGSLGSLMDQLQGIRDDLDIRQQTP